MTCSFVCSCIDARPEIIRHVWINIIYIHLICLDLLGFVCFAARVIGCMHCLELNILFFCGSPITSHVILSMFSNSVSGIPSSTGPSPGTTKNLNLAVSSLCLNITVHTPNCSILDWLYVFSMTELFLVACKATTID